MLDKSFSDNQSLIEANDECSRKNEDIIIESKKSFSSCDNSSHNSFIGRVTKEAVKNQILFKFSWKNLSVCANSTNIKINKQDNPDNIPKKKKKKTKLGDINQIYEVNEKKFVLHNISGEIISGEMVAILGSSGSGKTTFLNVISNQKSKMKNLKIQGEVLLNNKNIKEFDHEANSIISYVPQDDVLEPYLTPKETFLFVAKLKLKQSLSSKEIEKKVSDLLKFLNLSSCQDTPIGDILKKGISGGERKRTFIGLHLISDPNIIILDEPTTGLDSYNSHQVIKNLRKLTKKLNKIVILSIHSPSSELFPLFQRIFLLAEGKEIFNGRKEAILNYFTNRLEMPLKPDYNPFEHFLETTSQDFVQTTAFKKKNFLRINNNSCDELTITENDCEKADKKEEENKYLLYRAYIKHLNEIYEFSKADYFVDDFCDYEGEFSSFKIFENKKYTNSKLSFFYEFYMIFLRETLINFRNNSILFFKIGVNITITILIGILYSNIGSGVSAIENRMGFFNLCNLCITNGASIFTMLVFSQNHKIFLQERSNGLYSLSSYYLAKVCAEIPISFISSSLAMFICALGGVTYSFFLGSIVHEKEALSSLQQIWIGVLTQVSGYFASPQNYLFYFKLLTYISIQYHALRFISSQEFSDMQPLSCALDGTRDQVCDPFKNRVVYLQNPYYEILYNIIIIIFFNLIAFLFIFIKSKRS